MFVKNDCTDHDDLAACCRAASAIEVHPRDYFLGLPDPSVTMPKNILLFTRRAPFDHEPGYEHHRFVLILSLAGEGSVIVDDLMVRLRPGCGLLVTPHQFHHYAGFAGNTLLWVFVGFELEDLEGLSTLRGRLLAMTPWQVKCLRELVEIYAALEGQRLPSPEVTLLAALLLEGFRESSSTGMTARPTDEGVVPTSYAIVQAAARYVHGHVTQAIHIRDVARAVGLSESHLRTRFRTLVGIGLGAYIRRMRLHRARAMMFASELRLKEIAERCGYDSIYTFSRAFRQGMGMSPSQYRHRFR